MEESPASMKVPEFSEALRASFNSLFWSQFAKNSMAVEMKKQISIFLPVSDWRALYLEAARQRVPITELCRRWLLPEIRQLPREEQFGKQYTREGAAGQSSLRTD